MPTFATFIVVDNWYTAQEEKGMWSELDYYSYKENIDRAENTVVGRNMTVLKHSIQMVCRRILFSE